MDTVVRAVEGRATLITALTWTPALTISHQHAPSGRRWCWRTGETLQTRKIDQNAITAAEPEELQYPKSASAPLYGTDIKDKTLTSNNGAKFFYQAKTLKDTKNNNIYIICVKETIFNKL